MNQDTLNFIESEVSETYNNSEFEFLDLIKVFHKSDILKLEDLSSLVSEDYLEDLNNINERLITFLFIDILFDDIMSTEDVEYVGSSIFTYENIFMDISKVIDTGCIIISSAASDKVFISVDVEHFCLDELDDYQEFIRNACELERIVSEFNVGIYINTSK